MKRFGPRYQQQQQQQSPIPNDFGYGFPRPKRVVDGLPHVCPEGHNHSAEAEAVKCMESHRVFVCASNHMHTDKDDGKRCDEIKREEDIFRDKEAQRKHEREMMDKNIKLADNLRAMGWNFKRNGMPQLPWND